MHVLRAAVVALAGSLMLDACTVPDNVVADQKNAGLHAVAGKFPDRYTFDEWVASRSGEIPDPAVVLSFSGGFWHAAALANGVLKNLARYEVCSPERKSAPASSASCNWEPLLNHVILISSTSGGSYATANFVANGSAGLDSFGRFLTSDIRLELGREMIIRPWTWLSIVGPVSNRSQFMMDVINRSLLPRPPHGRYFTFHDLSSKRPFAIFGATDYVAERHFIFTQESFDDLCSDLSKLPLAEAVTASGGFPFFLTDVELKNYWPDGCPLAANPALKLGDSTTRQAAFNDKQAFLDSRYSDSLRRASLAPQDPPVFHGEMVLHLFDGGMADNLAVRPVMRLLTESRLRDQFAGRTILYVQVNARSDPETSYALRNGSPWWWDLATGVPYVSIDNDTALSNYTAFSYWNGMFYWNSFTKKPRATNDARFARAMYIAEVDYDQDPNARRQAELKQISGAALSKHELSLLYREAAYLMANHPCFEAFLADSHFKFRRNGESASGKPTDVRCMMLKPGTFAVPVQHPPALQ